MHRLNHYPADSVIVSLILIRWIVIYPMDSAIQRLNNLDQDDRYRYTIGMNKRIF